MQAERVSCRCPDCGNWRAVLYSRHGRFLCVPCNRLAYSSTREEAKYRLNRRGQGDEAAGRESGIGAQLSGAAVQTAPHALTDL